MSENENSFVPHSDEELARLLEQQMRELRAQTGSQPRVPQNVTPITPVQPVVSVTPPEPAELAPPAPVELTPPAPRDPELDQIFNALLEDTAPAPVAAVVVEPEFKPVVADSELLETEPLMIIREDVSVVALEESPVPPAFVEQVVQIDFRDVDEAVAPQVVVIEETLVREESAEIVSIAEANPVTHFERRPSFDELVFGADSQD